jgi:hypothetical protein
MILDNTKMQYSKVDLETSGIRWRFKGLSHLIDFVNYRYKSNKRFSRYKSSAQTKDENYNSHNSLQDAILETTKTKLLPKEIRKLILTESKSSTMQIVDTGGVVSVPHYLSNQPEHFQVFVDKTRLKPQKQRGEKIFISCSVLANVDSKEYEQYLLNTIIDIYKKYYNPEIVLCFISQNINSAGETFELYIEVPSYEVNSVMRMTFTDFYRRIIFFVREQCPSLDSGYGQSINKSDIICKHKFYTFYN